MKLTKEQDELIKYHEQLKVTWAGLSVRARYRLDAANYKNKTELHRDAVFGKIHERMKQHRVFGFGHVTYVEIMRWLGLPVEEKKPLKLKCPHCGRFVNEKPDQNAVTNK